MNRPSLSISFLLSAHTHTHIHHMYSSSNNKKAHIHTYTYIHNTKEYAVSVYMCAASICTLCSNALLPHRSSAGARKGREPSSNDVSNSSAAPRTMKAEEKNESMKVEEKNESMKVEEEERRRTR